MNQFLVQIYSVYRLLKSTHESTHELLTEEKERVVTNKGKNFLSLKMILGFQIVRWSRFCCKLYGSCQKYSNIRNNDCWQNTNICSHCKVYRRSHLYKMTSLSFHCNCFFFHLRTFWTLTKLTYLEIFASCLWMVVDFPWALLSFPPSLCWLL